MSVSKYFQILGISSTSTNEEIKRAYKEIALSCHPDKLTNMPDGEEKQKKIDRFKEATIAYNFLTSKSNEYSDDSIYDDINWNDISNWKDIWYGIFTNNSETKDIIRDTFVDIANSFIQSKIFPKESNANKIQHNLNVEITYKELLLNAKKKLRLVLVDIDVPIFVDLSCGCFPKAVKEYTDDDDKEHEIIINMVIKKQDNFDHIYSEKTGTIDIITTIEITLLEYILGGQIQVPYIDGNSLSIQLPVFQNDLYEIPKMGIKNGSLIVNISIKNPTEFGWNKLSDTDKDTMVRFLKKIYD